MIVIDRIENGFAICEINGVMTDIPLTKIRPHAREGDILIYNGESSLYTVDHSATEERKAVISERFARLKARSKR